MRRDEYEPVSDGCELALLGLIGWAGWWLLVV